MSLYARILVPTDGSETAQAGLDEALRLARTLGSTLDIVHVMDSLRYANGLEKAAIYADQLVPMMRKHGEEVLATALAHAQARDVQAKTRLLDAVGESTAECIVREARTCAADLIVIGSHGRHGLPRWMLGSDADQVLRTSPVPVLLVRHGDRASEIPLG